MNPYRVEGPACISFSGGRTSAFMLRQILDAHAERLPDDVHVLFANTGKERVETLDFVHECETRWGVAIHWIEAHILPGEKLTHTFREVTYETASRAGEPFEAMIVARSFLPNPVMRICTQELKIRPMKKFAQEVLGFVNWTNVIGLRADEPRRVAKTKAPNREAWENETPLADAGVTLADVTTFWREQAFDLRLRPHEGNCDLCFLKGRARIERILRERPDLAAWWVRQEEHRFGVGDDARFRHDRPSYARMLRVVQATPYLPGLGFDDDALPCACTD